MRSPPGERSASGRPPGLRRRVWIFLALLHVAFAAVAVRVLWEDPRWLFAVEALLGISLVLAIRFARSVLLPLGLIATGSELIAERDFTTRFRPVGQPELDRLVEVYNRMIDELRAERLRVREKNELLDRIVEASPGGIVIADPDGRVAEMNPAAATLLAIPAPSGVGRPLGELGGPVGAALATLSPEESRIVGLPDGRRVRLRRASFRDQGFLRHFFLVEELTRELRASERAAYGKLIRTMSHEVNNSVGAVGSLLGSLGGLAHQLPETRRETAVRALSVASERLESLAAFMQRLASVVRVPEPERRPCDVERLVDDVLELYAATFEDRGIAVERRRALDARLVALDKNQIEQVLVNVVKNAVEAMPGGGRLTVTTTCPEGAGDGLLLTLEDTGEGLPEPVREHLFDPFFTTKEQGCGLGLTLAREILGRHGFPFALEPRPAGGARFRVTLV